MFSPIFVQVVLVSDRVLVSFLKPISSCAPKARMVLGRSGISKLWKAIWFVRSTWPFKTLCNETTPEKHDLSILIVSYRVATMDRWSSLLFNIWGWSCSFWNYEDHNSEQQHFPLFFLCGNTSKWWLSLLCPTTYWTSIHHKNFLETVLQTCIWHRTSLRYSTPWHIRNRHCFAVVPKKLLIYPTNP
jgi:hypothetical protein